MATIGLDIGTTFIKAALLDLDGPIVGRTTRLPFPDPQPARHPGIREYDPRQVLQIVRRLTEEQLAAADVVDGIVICTQMHGLILVDVRGDAHSMISTWQDSRSAMPDPTLSGRSCYQALMARLDPGILQACGNEMRPDLPIARLFTMRQYGELASGLMPLALADFIVTSLCSSTPISDVTNAHATGAFDLVSMSWHNELIRRLGLDDLRWPELCPIGALSGELAWRGRKIPCYAPIGDCQAALVGALLEPDELSLNLATGGQVSVLADACELGTWQTRPFPDGRFLKGFYNVPAGRSLEVLVRLLAQAAVENGATIDEVWRYATDEANRVRSSSLTLDLSFFECSTGSRGAITGIREEELTVGHLMRAALEGLASHYHDCAGRLDHDSPCRRLVFSGGVARRLPLLRRLITERFGLPGRVSPHPEDALLGLALLGQACTGRAASVKDAVTAYRTTRREHCRDETPEPRQDGERGLTAPVGRTILQESE